MSVRLRGRPCMHPTVHSGRGRKTKEIMFYGYAVRLGLPVRPWHSCSVCNRRHEGKMSRAKAEGNQGKQRDRQTEGGRGGGGEKMTMSWISDLHMFFPSSTEEKE